MNVSSDLIIPFFPLFLYVYLELHIFAALKKSYFADVIPYLKNPFLGICLGMQLLASLGTEGCEIDGLNFIKGKVVKLEPKQKNEFIPHVGWNEVFIKKEDFPMLPPRIKFCLLR